MLEARLKPATVLCLALGLALAASAANVTWTGAKADPNGLGFWDDPGNWTAYPTAVDQPFIQLPNSTVVVDDFDDVNYPVKECSTLVLSRNPADANVTLWIRSYDGSGPGGKFKCGVAKVAQANSPNCRIIVDAGECNIANLRTLQLGTPGSGSVFITVNGGVLNAGKLSLTELAIAGHEATLTVNGGLANVTGDLVMGASPAKARINLKGGKLSVGGKLIATSALALDMSAGTLALKGDQSALITQLASSGQLTIAGGTAQRGGLFATYDAAAGATTVTVDPSMANPNRAWKAQPTPGTSGVATGTQSLTWTPGDSTAAKAGHDVYFGTDPNAVSNDSANNALGTYRGRVDTASMAMPVVLQMSQTYYWRVDQINSAGAITKGTLWSFTVTGSALIDDFEAYNNTEPNQIWMTWKDGIGLQGNGMRVGHWDPNYAETKIVKQGKQSMPLFYDTNTVVVNAEAKRTFASAQNWTKNGVKSLSLKFRGESTNTLGKVYVKINNTKVVYPLLASHMQFAQWKPWIINFKDVAADLSKVTSLAIGVDGPGKGTLYIDDIRLYPKEAELMPALGSGVQPDKTRLVAQYLFDGNAQDSSGNGHHGTVKEGGTANWVAGVFDGALDFSQMFGLDCGDFDPTGGTGKFTVSLWCYWKGGLIQHLVTKSAGWAANTMMFQIELKGTDAWVAEQDRNRLNLAYQNAAQAGFDSVPAHEWVHLALTFDGTKANGYLNGIDSVGPRATGIGPNVAAPVVLGATEGGARILQGLLDDVRIYSYPLTPAEVYGTIGVDLGYKPF